MSTKENEALARRFFDEVCNGHALGVANELFAAGHTYHDPANPAVRPGPAGMKDLIHNYHSAFADASWTVEEMIGGGDDYVVTRWTGRGTHTGDLTGIAPTGRKVEVQGIWIHRIARGEIVKSWNVWDTLGMMQQLGVMPAARRA